MNNIHEITGRLTRHQPSVNNAIPVSHAEPFNPADCRVQRASALIAENNKRPALTHSIS